MKILFIGSRLFDDVAFYLKDKNIESVLTESNPEADNLDLADQCFIVPRGMDAPEAIAISQNVDAIIPLIGIDGPLMDVAIMKEKIEAEHNIPVIASGIDVISLTSDKIKTKSFFEDISITTPKYAVINKDNLDELNDFDFPIVLKQGEGQGGKDIKIAKNIDDVNSYFEKFDQALCEEFIDGSEISIEVIGHNDDYVSLVPVYKGETTLEGTHPIAKSRSAPSEIDGLSNDSVHEIALKIAKNLKPEGIIDIDLIFSPKDSKLYALEINARPNGTRFLTEASSGINTILKLVDIANDEFDSDKIKNQIKSYYAREIPVGNYNGPNPSEPLKSFINNDFVVHGPENYQRVTFRADSKENLDILSKKLLI